MSLGDSMRVAGEDGRCQSQIRTSKPKVFDEKTVANEDDLRAPMDAGGVGEDPRAPGHHLVWPDPKKGHWLKLLDDNGDCGTRKKSFGFWDLPNGALGFLGARGGRYI